MRKEEARVLLRQVASMYDYSKTIRLDKDLAEACRLGADALAELSKAEEIFPEILRT